MMSVNFFRDFSPRFEIIVNCYRLQCAIIFEPFFIEDVPKHVIFVTDGRTDRQTDEIKNTWLCIISLMRQQSSQNHICGFALIHSRVASSILPEQIARIKLISSVRPSVCHTCGQQGPPSGRSTKNKVRRRILGVGSRKQFRLPNFPTLLQQPA